LFEDEFYLFAFGERAVGFDVDFLEYVGCGCDVAGFLLSYVVMYVYV
jgi:hypothetical protein